MRQKGSLYREKIEKLLVLVSLLVPFLCLYSVILPKLYFFSLFFIGLALYLDFKGIFFPRWMITLIGFLFIMLFFLSVDLVNFLEKSIQTILLLLGLKLLEKKRLRDYFQIYLLEFLLLAGVSFYYTALWFFLVLIFQVFYIGFALFFHLYVEEGEVKVMSLPELKIIFLYFGFLLLNTFILSIIFFILLPRVQNPLINIAGVKNKATTGFSENIRLGAFSEIQENTQPAFRLAFEEGKIFHPENIYFRVIVYDTFDGKNWSRKETEVKPWQREIYQRKKGAWGKIYTNIYMEGYLPSLYELIFVKEKGEIEKFSDNVLRWKGIPEEMLKYEVYVQKEKVWEIKEDLPEEKKNLYLQIPKLSLSIIKLSQKLKGDTPEETLENILQFFSKEGFSYALKGLPLGENPLEDFLFKAKRGNCEYFASATALLLRLNGIPARVVGGYRGAIYLARGKYYLVKQNFAHSWVEAWIKGSWKLIDPTPVASLSILRKENTTFAQLKLLWETINYYYIKFILDYDLKKQKKLLGALKSALFLREGEEKVKMEKSFHRINFKEFKTWVKVLVIFTLLGIFLWIFWNRSKLFQKREKKMLHRFLSYLEKRGYQRRENEGLFELIEKIRDPLLQEKSLEFVKIYAEYYYRERKFDKEGLQRLEECLKDIQRLKLK